MSERWWRRRRKKHPWFNDFYDTIDRLEEMAQEIFQRAFETSSERPKARRPYVYGFSMADRPDGKPVIQEFGNVQPSRRGSKIWKERGPLVDVIEENNGVVIVAELLGVGKDDITLQAFEDHLTVSVDSPNRKCHKEIVLPARVDPKSACASYNNGVLEIRLKKFETKVEGESIPLK